MMTSVPHKSSRSVDGKTAKNAVSKAAKHLRILLADQDARSQFIREGLLSKEISQADAIKELQKRVFENPKLFNVMLAVVSGIPGGTDAANKLQGCIPPKTPPQERQKVQVQVQSPLADLRRKLETLKELDVQQHSEEMQKSTINEAITKTLEQSLDMKLVKEELSKMYQDRLFSFSVFQWTVTEIEERHKKHITHTANLFQQCIPIKLNNTYLYHASLCSVAVNRYDTDGCIRLFRSLSHSVLKKVSISHVQDKIGFPKCMVANVNDVYIVAFESHFDFNIWTKINEKVHRCTFGKGLEYIIGSFPTLFFEHLIKNNCTLILTGFSFGGVLAHMLSAQLWQLPQLHSDQLMSNLLCITFGVPDIQSQLLTRVAEVFPDFKSNIHTLRMDNDSIPFILEKLDSIVCFKEDLFQSIVEDLLHLQEFIHMREHSPVTSRDASIEHDDTTATKLQTLADRGVSHLQQLQQSFVKQLQQSYITEENIQTATTYLIVPGEYATAGLHILRTEEDILAYKRMEVKMSDMTVQKFQYHSAGVYNKCIKVYVMNSEQNPTNAESKKESSVVRSDFLVPVIERVQVTKYGNEATIVIRGKQLWFSHSLHLSAVVQQPFQIQEESVSFSANISDISDNLIADTSKEKEICLLSYFSTPVIKKVFIELNAKLLSPRGRQLARLEPAHLLELAFTTALFERGQMHLDESSSRHFSPLFHHINSFLHEIALVVPFESILCSIAYSKHQPTVDLCKRKIEELHIKFPFTLMSRSGLLVASARNLGIFSSEQNPLEDCAYFSWLSSKLFAKLNCLFGDDDDIKLGQTHIIVKLCFYLLGTTGSVITVGGLRDNHKDFLTRSLASTDENEYSTELSAVSSMSAVDLYAIEPDFLPDEKIKSPMAILNEGRRKLSSENSDSGHPNKDIMMALADVRGEQLNLCIGVLCGFMYQPIRVPFTEDNPVTFFKTVRIYIGPLWNCFKSLTKHLVKEVFTETKDASTTKYAITDTENEDNDTAANCLVENDPDGKRPDLKVTTGLEFDEESNHDFECRIEAESDDITEQGFVGQIQDNTEKEFMRRNSEYEEQDGSKDESRKSSVEFCDEHSDNLSEEESEKDSDDEFVEIVERVFDETTLTTIARKCRKMVTKGTQVAGHMYDGKLKFLVSNIDQKAGADIAPSSSDFCIYALEQTLKDLCLKHSITVQTSIDTIVNKWADYFKNCPLVNVAKSHHSLIARWIKWSLMVGELRVTLEKYTTITVAGLVNSGKSQLMKTLFGLDVKTGTIESRRTTVPFIYTLAPKVDGVNVIDFPGADDNDQDVIQPIEFLKFISQVVVFVVHYEKVHTKAAKEWLKKFEVTEGGGEEELELMKNNLRSVISGQHFESKKPDGEKVPVLVCLTFADRLLVRDFMNQDSGQYNIGEAEKGIAKHFENIAKNVYDQGVWNPKGRRTIGYYCFSLNKRSTLSENDMKKVGIGTPLDVGNWICRQLKDELHMPDVAGQLSEYFKHSCRNLKSV